MAVIHLCGEMERTPEHMVTRDVRGQRLKVRQKKSAIAVNTRSVLGKDVWVCFDLDLLECLFLILLHSC